jgi:hypothetical protein
MGLPTIKGGTMAAKHIRVLMVSNKSSDRAVDGTAGSVLGKLPGNKNFPNPPVDPAVLQAALSDFRTAAAAAVKGGVHATAEKNRKKHELVALLRKLALYVQANCNEEVSILTSSGFQAASTVRTLGPLPKPDAPAVENGHTTQLLLTVPKVPKAKSYEVQVAPVTGSTIGAWQGAGTFTKSRKLPVNGLTPATTYAFRVRAIGGTTGCSDWSDPVTHMCM